MTAQEMLGTICPFRFNTFPSSKLEWNIPKYVIVFLDTFSGFCVLLYFGLPIRMDLIYIWVLETTRMECDSWLFLAHVL